MTKGKRKGSSWRPGSPKQPLVRPPGRIFVHYKKTKQVDCLPSANHELTIQLDDVHGSEEMAPVEQLELKRETFDDLLDLRRRQQEKCPVCGNQKEGTRCDICTKLILCDSCLFGEKRRRKDQEWTQWDGAQCSQDCKLVSVLIVCFGCRKNCHQKCE